MNDFPQMVFGKKIQISEPVPRMRCSPAFERLQSPELVESTNAWMASFFGYTDMMKDGQVYELVQQNTLVMNRNTFNQLREEMQRNRNEQR